MSDHPRHLRMYLPQPLYQSARAGEHNFLRLIEDVARRAGYSVEVMEHDTASMRQASRDPGYSLFHMEEPFATRSVTIRRAYFYPFWQIERVGRRWQFEVAKTPFPTSAADHPDITRFFRFWQKRQFGDAATKARKDGFVLMPLQGRLRDKRSFQTCSPERMIANTLEQVAGKPVIATLHPNETYSEQEIATLEKLESTHDNFEVRMGGSNELLAGCDYVVTQNSSVAFSALFFEKPSILFAAADFHHVAANVADTGVEGAFEMILSHKPDYAAYAHWFLQEMCINAGRPEARKKIEAALVKAGWPMDKK